MTLRTTFWNDPMSDKYPSMSPYNYCANNPVILVDPDGREYVDPDPPTTYTIKKGDTFWGIENKYNLPHGILKSANPFLDPRKLKIGAVINMTTYGDDLPVVPNDVKVQGSNDFSQPASTGPTIDLSNYKTLAPFLTLWDVAGMFVGSGSQYVFKGPPAKTMPYNVTIDVPKGWNSKPSNKGGGTVYYDPNNSGNSIRVMPGNPKSPNPGQQVPYVKFMKNGQYYNANGKMLPNGNVQESHIPVSKFNMKKMPKF